MTAGNGKDDVRGPMPTMRGALDSDPHESSRAAEELFSEERTEAEEANEEMKDRRSRRPDDRIEAPLKGGVMPPD